MNLDEARELRDDLETISTRMQDAVSKIQPALQAQQDGMTVLKNICSLITSDEKLLRDMHLRKAAIEMIDAAERWLEKHHQFKADMRNAERTFLGVQS